MCFSKITEKGWNDWGSKKEVFCFTKKFDWPCSNTASECLGQKTCQQQILQGHRRGKKFQGRYYCHQGNWILRKVEVRGLRLTRTSNQYQYLDKQSLIKVTTARSREGELKTFFKWPPRDFNIQFALPNCIFRTNTWGHFWPTCIFAQVFGFKYKMTRTRVALVMFRLYCEIHLNLSIFIPQVHWPFNELYKFIDCLLLL